jgi:ADP-ribose pyrophosphatase
MTELPAGKLDKGEDPLKCASRELTEETGYSSGNIKELGKIFSSPGFCNEVLHIYSATDLIPGEHAREEGEEGMEIIELSLSEAEEKIRTGEIVDAKTISGLYMYKNKL